MKANKLPCGCIVQIDRRLGEIMPPENMCDACRERSETRYAAAVESCSHVARDRLITSQENQS